MQQMPRYRPGQKVKIAAEHMSGTMGEDVTIFQVAAEPVYAVMMPDGTVHRWFAESELAPVMMMNRPKI